VPTILAIPKCVGMSVVASRETGMFIVATAWETRDAMHASVVRIRPIRDQTAKILEGAAEVEEWEFAAMNRREGSAPSSCVRVTWLRVQSADADAFAQDFNDQTLPALRAVRGFSSASLLLNREWGRAAVSIAYDNPEAMERRITRADGKHGFGDNVIGVKDFDYVLPHLRVPDLASY
jgi:heme-degrading monooxygenase HmoA